MSTLLAERRRRAREGSGVLQAVEGLASLSCCHQGGRVVHITRLDRSVSSRHTRRYRSGGTFDRLGEPQAGIGAGRLHHRPGGAAGRQRRLHREERAVDGADPAQGGAGGQAEDRLRTFRRLPHPCRQVCSLLASLNLLELERSEAGRDFVRHPITVTKRRVIHGIGL